eukprot:CAMPEP_0185723898 /NCGR_PEP_ID=MMETSP1171-20130828/577_1 /TAXON_ID=374046 /ORGANISM="Helicotheca tamensis, Strain CCMP826" /LENGTH=246 /DNA_ID=CAMNT_0028391665 /DNA_START=84 /DNA_END=821 /DNA_ORIENTATION=+
MADSTQTNAPPPWANPGGTSASAQMNVTEDSGVGGGGMADDGQEFLGAPFSTLDEPVMETIMRDVRSVASKLKVVLLPLDRSSPFGYANVSQEDMVPAENQRQVLTTLRDWDLWGPLFVCLALSVILSFKAPSQQASAVFAAVFVAIWVGSAVVTINAQLLGGTISFFQSVCVLGYCVFPMTVSALIIGLLRVTPLGVVWLDLIWAGLGFVWATRASTIFIGQYIARERRALAVFPVFFFYTFLGW